MKKIYLLLICITALNTSWAQDNCASALSIELDEVYTIDEINGSQDPPIICTSGGDSQSSAEWFTYTSVIGGLLNVSTDLEQNEGIDTRVHIYNGNCEFLECIGGDDDSGSGYLSIATVYVDAGETIYLAFDDRWTTEGFDFVISEQEAGDLPFFIASGPGISGNARCVVDMNGDFLDDIVGTNEDGLIIQYQQEDGSFIEETILVSDIEFSPSWSIAAGDIDGNGYNDLLFGNGTGVSFIYANEDGTEYTESHTDEYVFCQRTNFIDINNDGHLDAFVCHDVEPNVFYLNDGEGNLSHNQGGMGDTPNGGNYGSVWVDFDNDGKPDLFIAKCRGGDNPANINQMHRNIGGGNFIEVAEEIGLMDNIQTWSSAWGDYDNDGDMDAYIGASSDENGSHKLMINNGIGQFEDNTSITELAEYTDTGIENAPYDFDNDGYIDIITNNFDVLKNNGDLTFTAVAMPFSKGAIGDLNNDGFLDVVSGGSIYFNSGNENNYLKINTVGTTSNINGIGARITVETALGSQIRDVRSGESFSVMSSLTTHFGLGTAEEITSITITWPSGIVDYITDAEVNSTITITEGTISGISDNDLLNLEVYPNPTTDFIQIINEKLKSGDLITIVDQNGKVVQKSILNQSRIDVSTLSAGIYFVQLNIDGADHQVQFIKR